MRRRAFIAGLGSAAVWPMVARGQSGRSPRIGFMGNSTAELEANLLGAFLAGLREHGYEEWPHHRHRVSVGWR